MLCYVWYCFLVSVTIALCQELTGLVVMLTPDKEEIVLNEDDPLEITCIGIKEIDFSFPRTTEYGNTSNEEISRHFKNGEYVSTFRRKKTIYGDTGWYACGNNKIYVYVTSETEMFVERPDKFRGFTKHVSDDVVIPCRPTSPYLNITLYKDDNPVKLSNTITYDPRTGFTIKDLKVRDSAVWKCVAERNNMQYEVSYIVHVNSRLKVPIPIILNHNLRYVMRGQTLRITCMAEYDSKMWFALKWTTPQQDKRKNETSFGAYPKKYNNLTISDVMDEDAGEYICESWNEHFKKTASINITVQDPENKYLNLTPQNNDTYTVVEKGERVQWIVEIDAYPQPNIDKIQWKGPLNQEITGNWSEPETSKYAINKTAYSTIFRINDLGVENSGNYTLSVENKYSKKTVEFMLQVLARPYVITEKKTRTEDPYYNPNELVEVKCGAIAYPAPNITWSCKKYFDYPSDFNSTITVLTNSTVTDETLWKFTSVVNMTADFPTRICCNACNPYGCDESCEDVLISDVKNAFDIVGPKGPITVGDNFELICRASIYNYSSVTWEKNWTDSSESNNRFEIIEDKTAFTRRSILKINNVQKSDSKRYNCVATMHNDTQLKNDEEYNLEVDDERAPIFKYSNLNDTETVFNVNTGDPQIVDLWCIVDGRPIPTVTWFKDSVVLTNNSRYSFYGDNQKFRIQYLNEDDTGRYMCRAENRISRKEVYQQLTVKGKELPKGLIALIAILFIIVIILLVFFAIKMRREKIMRKELMKAGLMHFEEGALECLNPDLTVDDQAELLPYDKKWEFPRERLKLGKQLGSGAFGVVMKAEAQGICEDEAVTTVAVKMVRRTTDPTYVRALASELKIMVHLGKHLNVVNLLGACTKNISKRELLVIVEYCRFGNLHNYLLRHRADFINQINPATGKFDPTIGADLLTRTASTCSNNRVKYAALSFSRSLSANSGTDSVQYCPGTATDLQSPDSYVLSNNSSQPGWRSNYRGDYKDQNLKPICTQDLLSWAFQVAQGMEYLSQRRVLHGDLAARNILLAENNVVKICDFGLAKTMYKDNNYKKKGDGPLPIKWMAIESIRDRIFSTQSDIWSFGIVLWEFFTLAETPYPGMEAEKQYQKLIEGYRMEKPEYSTAEVYDIMLQCWKAKPTLRPSFTEVVEGIGDLLDENVRMHYVSLNAPYMDMNTMMLENGKNDYLTMMSRPDHTALSSPTHKYVNSPVSETAPDSAYLCMSPSGQLESGIFSPRPLEEGSHFEFPSLTSDSEDAVELSPMLEKEENPYLKPINVHERRAEFVRQRQAMKNEMMERPPERDSGYCNAPRNLQLIDLNEKSAENEKVGEKVDSKDKDFVPSIIRTQDNYVNMPKQKSDFRKDMPDSFSNPSYVMMGNSETNKMKDTNDVLS